MALASKKEVYTGNRLRPWFDGVNVDLATDGLGWEPGVSEQNQPVYGDSNAVNTLRYASGPQSMTIADNANNSYLNHILAGFDAENVTDGVARAEATPKAHVAWYDTLDEAGTGHDKGSSLIANWKCRFSDPKAGPEGVMVRTIQGNADRPLACLGGQSWCSKRIALVSSGTQQISSATSPTPLVISELGSGIYSPYLEIQWGTGRDIATQEVKVDSTNVTVSGNGVSVTVTSKDVVDAGASGTITAWLLLKRTNPAAGTKISNDGRWGSTFS